MNSHSKAIPHPQPSHRSSALLLQAWNSLKEGRGTACSQGQGHSCRAQHVSEAALECLKKKIEQEMLRPEAQWFNPISIFFPSPSFNVHSQRQYTSFRGEKHDLSYVPVLALYQAKCWDTFFLNLRWPFMLWHRQQPQGFSSKTPAVQSLCFTPR